MDDRAVLLDDDLGSERLRAVFATRKYRTYVVPILGDVVPIWRVVPSRSYQSRFCESVFFGTK